jgi:acyl-CoA thioesterase-2
MFAQLLDLHKINADHFRAPQAPDKGERVYGGQFLGQCVSSCCHTVADDRRINSFHAYFYRPGDVDSETDMHVERVRDGRTFSSRQVTAKQNGRELFRMMASFQIPTKTPEYASVRMPDVPPPEAVTYTYDDFHLHASGDTRSAGAARPMDLLYINPPLVRGRPVTERQLMWVKVRGTVPDSPGAHEAGLAYLSDCALVDHTMVVHGRYWQDADFAGASLDHSMWFHHPVKADDWLLYSQGVEATGSGRGLARGHFFTRQGQLAATCMQEGLMRWLDQD